MAPSIREHKLAERIAERVLAQRKEKIWEYNPRIAQNRLEGIVLDEIMRWNREKVE